MTGSIVAIYDCLNEIDIVEMSLRHMLAEGVDHIYIADAQSTDGTRDVLDGLAKETGQLTIVTDTDPVFNQVHWMNLLAHMAAADGAEWLIPSDVDEFWYATNGGTVAEALLATEYPVVYARSFVHWDWDTRCANYKLLPKVAFKWNPNAEIVMGQHGVKGVGGGINDVLDIRELQYRSFEHFVHKVRAGLARIAPDVRARGDGDHYLRLENRTDEEMRVEWERMKVAGGMTHDPIPSNVQHG